jgi:ribosomal protein S18 acetylase RimI-like enzyme
MNAIRRARRDELERLREIEREAGQAFATIGMPEIAAHEPPPAEALEAFVSAGHAWVAVDTSDRPVGFLLSQTVDGCAHISEVSVAPECARRGLGARLIDHLSADATASRQPALTLTTFRDVPWNAPYYARLGFVVIEAGEQGPELRSMLEREQRSVPSHMIRVAMRRPTVMRV